MNLEKRNIKTKRNRIRKDHPHKHYGVRDISLIVLGAFIQGFGIRGFLIPNKFLDGGVTGISLLIHQVFGLQYSFIIIAVNIPLLVLGWRIINKHFVFKTLISLVCVSLFVAYIPYPVVTSDKLLVSVFGGFFSGLGMGLNNRAGSTLESLDVLALYTFRRSSFTVSEIIIAINAVVFLIAAFYFGIGTAMYSMLTYVTSTKTIDFVVEGIEEYTGVTIISGNSDRIKEKLVKELGRGITIYKGERGFLPGKYHLHTEVDIIFTVITRLELRKLKNLVEAEDPKAFVLVHTIKEAAGGVLTRKPTE